MKGPEHIWVRVLGRKHWLRQEKQEQISGEEETEEAPHLPHPVHQTAPHIEKDDAHLYFICKELHEEL